MTKAERHKRDLDFLRNQKEEPDMSPQAVTERMLQMGEICDLARLLGLPDIEFYQPDYDAIYHN